MTFAPGGGVNAPFVRIAQLRIDPAQIEAFKAAAAAVGRASIAEEPGCLALYAVADRDDVSHVTVFEIYRDEAAYQAHVRSAHFLHFRAVTDAMVQSRHLATAIPISLANKMGCA